MNAGYAAMEALVDELVRCGLREVCVSPGNRSAPLAFALARDPRIRVWTHVDERSGSFFALGRAREGRRPVALACTSGTAAANFLPAVVEARYGGVPLVVLTADRPVELRERSAPQTIDQLGLYGRHAVWSFDLGRPHATTAGLRHVRSMAGRAVREARRGGAAHLNLPLDDPLDPGEQPAGAFAPGPPGEPLTRFHPGPPGLHDDTVCEIALRLQRAERPLIYCGPLDPTGDAASAVGGLAERIGAPVLAEPISNLRGAGVGSSLVSAYEALLRDPAFDRASRPDVVLRLGGPPTSRTLSTWLDGSGAEQIVWTETDAWSDPGGRATHLLHTAIEPACVAVASQVERASSESSWIAHWRAAQVSAEAAIEAALRAEEGTFEGHVVRGVADAVQAGSNLYVASSLAVRVLDWFWPAAAPKARMLANRGANGIDGFVSSVLGAAAEGRPTIGLCGDLALFHDIGGLAAGARLGLSACFVVSNNGGGGIFDFLPTARGPEGYREHYEELFVTPLGLDLGPLSEALGARHECVHAPDRIAAAVSEAVAQGGVSVIEVPIDRAESRAAHGRIWDAVRAANGER